MPGPSPVEAYAPAFLVSQIPQIIFSKGADLSERVSAVVSVLQSRGGQFFREQMGKFVVQFLPVEDLVPERYAEWRPLVRDSMLYMFLHLSIPRLAPKLIEQIDLPPNTPTEARLLRLIAKVPGLQKLGQVLARNRHLHPSLRNALSELENGISDVSPEQIRAIIEEELGAQLKTHAVEIEAMFCEASVSAVVRFTWYNRQTGARERGVFKVMKPYIPECFSEDMELLAGLSRYIGSKHQEYGFAEHVLPETFQDVRRLLQHEVKFRREQKTLLQARHLYAAVRGVRVPQVIRPLCTSKITAMTEERGTKVTEAVAGVSGWRRGRIAEQLIDALVAIPLFAPEGDVMFHADPHAGNLLYDESSSELTVLDWALTEHLTRDQRRHLAMLFLMIGLRNPVGVCEHIQALNRGGHRRKTRDAELVRKCVAEFLDALPLSSVPSAVDAMDLLETIAFSGVRLPSSLLMLRKVMFTLDGILHDIAGSDVSMEFVMTRHLFEVWLAKWKNFGSPLSLGDWFLVQSSAVLYPSRLLVQWEQRKLEQSRKRRKAAQTA